MALKIAVMDGDINRCRNLCQWLEDHHYSGIAVHTLEQLQQCMAEHHCTAAIIDVESTGLHDRAVRTLARIHPGMHFLLISHRSYHPELKEALSYDVSACLTRPVDPEELLFWLESFENHLIPGEEA